MTNAAEMRDRKGRKVTLPEEVKREEEGDKDKKGIVDEKGKQQETRGMGQ